MEVKAGYKQSEVGIIPDDWSVKQIQEVCGFIVPGRNKPKAFDGDIPWITTPDLEDGRAVYASRSSLMVSKREADAVGSKIVPMGSVLMSCVGELGIVAITGRDIVINQQLHAFLPSKAIHKEFLTYAIKTRLNYLDSIATKTTIPYLNKDNCNSIPIPLPPVSEQKAIAEALSDADTLIQALEQLLAKKRQIKQGAMQELLTGKKRLPGFSGEWMVRRLGDVIKEIGDGATPSTSNPLNFGGSIHWAVIDDIRDEITTTRSTLTERGLHSCPAKLWQPGTLIVSTGATIGEVGIARIPLATKQGICGIVVDNAKADTVFLKFWFANNKFTLLAKAQGSTIREVRAPTLVQFEISLPSLKEQTAIAEILSDMDAEITALEGKLSKAREVKAGMMSELLTGRIRLVESGK